MAPDKSRKFFDIRDIDNDGFVRNGEDKPPRDAVENTDVGERSQEINGDSLTRPARIGVLSEEDEKITSFLRERNISYPRAVRWLKLLRGKLPADQEDKVAEDILSVTKHEIALTSSALAQHLETMHASRITKNVHGIITGVNQSLAHLAYATMEINSEEERVHQPANGRS